MATGDDGGLCESRLPRVFPDYRASQKFRNIAQNDRVAITVAHEPAQLRDIQAVYAGCTVHEVTDLAERRRAWELMAKRHPNLTDLAPPENGEVAIMAADCKHISVLDYTQGLGHTENVTVGCQTANLKGSTSKGLAGSRDATASHIFHPTEGSRIPSGRELTDVKRGQPDQTFGMVPRGGIEPPTP
jgi:hypothetical protein